jgi:hypothetical protein
MNSAERQPGDDGARRRRNRALYAAVGFGVAGGGDAAFNAHLTIQRHPVKAKGSMRVLFNLVAFATGVVGVK